MGAMSWLVTIKLDLTGEASNKPKPCLLDMARAHTLVWGRHTDAPDTWSVGWCMLPRSEGLIKDTLVSTRSQEAPCGERGSLLGGLSNSLVSKA